MNDAQRETLNNRADSNGGLRVYFDYTQFTKYRLGEPAFCRPKPSKQTNIILTIPVAAVDIFFYETYFVNSHSRWK